MERHFWLITVTDPRTGRCGVGECAPLPSLSCDDLPEYEDILDAACQQVEASGCIDCEGLRPYPSILFGLETAFRHLVSGSLALADTPFSRGEAGIPINGLIWMGSYDYMYEQIQQKIAEGFRCIKLKIGAINFEEELALLRYIRERVPASSVQLRVDANGAFSPKMPGKSSPSSPPWTSIPSNNPSAPDSGTKCPGYVPIHRCLSRSTRNLSV